MTVLNSLDLDEVQYFVGPDLVPNSETFVSECLGQNPV